MKEDEGEGYWWKVRSRKKSSWQSDIEIMRKSQMNPDGVHPRIILPFYQVHSPSGWDSFGLF